MKDKTMKCYRKTIKLFFIKKKKTKQNIEHLYDLEGGKLSLVRLQDNTNQKGKT